MAERDERRLIPLLERHEHSRAGAAQLVQPFAGHAVAHVEREDDVERDFIEADQVDDLRHTVVDDLEVAGTQAADRLAVIGNEHVDADGFDLRRERRALLRPTDGRQQQHRDRRRHTSSHCKRSARNG